MIVDSSALVAILRNEPEAASFAQVVALADPARVSAPTYLETGIVVESLGGRAAGLELDDLIHATGIVIEPFTEQQARMAREAYRDFGKGSGHPAQLNFGDCFSYALAKAMGEPLLFKGSDFGHTDVRRAV